MRRKPNKSKAKPRRKPLGPPMKVVKWTDKDGYKHLSLLRATDPDELATRGMGIPHDPPSLDSLDWETLKKKIHNALVDRRLSTWKEVQLSGNGIMSALSVLRREIVALYRSREEKKVQ